MNLYLGPSSCPAHPGARAWQVAFLETDVRKEYHAAVKKACAANFGSSSWSVMRDKVDEDIDFDEMTTGEKKELAKEKQWHATGAQTCIPFFLPRAPRAHKPLASSSCTQFTLCLQELN